MTNNNYWLQTETGCMHTRVVKINYACIASPGGINLVGNKLKCHRSLVTEGNDWSYNYLGQLQLFVDELECKF